MSTLIPPERTKVTIDDDNHVEPVDGDGVEWAAVFKVTAFHPLTIELPDVGATVAGPVKVELPRIRVTVKRLLSEVFDPRGLAPAIVGDMPVAGEALRRQGEVDEAAAHRRGAVPEAQAPGRPAIVTAGLGLVHRIPSLARDAAGRHRRL